MLHYETINWISATTRYPYNNNTDHLQNVPRGKEQTPCHSRFILRENYSTFSLCSVGFSLAKLLPQYTYVWVLHKYHSTIIHKNGHTYRVDLWLRNGEFLAVLRSIPKDGECHKIRGLGGTEWQRRLWTHIRCFIFIKLMYVRIRTPVYPQYVFKHSHVRNPVNITKPRPQHFTRKSPMNMCRKERIKIKGKNVIN